MASGAFHYTESERLLGLLGDHDRLILPEDFALVAAATAHATLAVAAAVAVASGRGELDSQNEWTQAIR